MFEGSSDKVDNVETIEDQTSRGGCCKSALKAQMGYEGQLGVQTLNLDKDILEGVTMEEQLTEMMPASCNSPVPSIKH